MTDVTDLHLNYIAKQLITEIVAKLENESFERYEVEHATGLDGFMSALYTIKVCTKTKEGPKERLLITKFMKGDVNFRESSKSYTQFANEITIYSKVLPAYQRLLEQASITDVGVENWVPPCFVAKFGIIEGLSATPETRECILVLENLKPLGYTLGPRLYLTRDHLLKVVEPLAEYHAMSYVLRLRQQPLLQQLKSSIVTLPFCNDADPLDDKTNLFKVIYRLAFDRFYEYFDRIIDDGVTFDTKAPEDLRLIENLRKMRAKYMVQPAQLLEHIRTDCERQPQDARFSAILHGDYNRNNVLFRYKQSEEAEKPVGDQQHQQQVQDVKMIDFQELRYGTPAIDLSFVMFMNTSSDIRADVWQDILQRYHSKMFGLLSRVLKAGVKDVQQLSDIDKELEDYSFEHFLKHFSKYALYGALICMHFLPWLLCSEAECEELSQQFESDMHGAAFRKISLEAGGDGANVQILEALRHASRMGYMDII